MRASHALLAVLALATACNTVDEENAPAKLQDIAREQARATRLWQLRLGDDPSHDDFSTPQMHLADGRLYAASGRSISAIDAASGDLVWRVRMELPLPGALGVGSGVVLAVDSEGTAHALAQSDGGKLWERSLGSEVLAAPAVADGAAVMLAADGRILALDIASGERKWSADNTKPVLSISGNSPPLISDGTVFSAQDNGKVVALRLGDGALLWETRVSIPEGVNEIERMVDIDAPLQLFSGLLYALSYQGNIMALDPATGNPIWSRPASSLRTMGAQGGLLVLTDDGDLVRALGATTGEPIWDSEQLARRGLSGPVLNSDHLIVVDAAGYLHILRRNTGALVGRASTGIKGPVRTPLLLDGEILYIQGTAMVQAWHIQDTD